MRTPLTTSFSMSQDSGTTQPDTNDQSTRGAVRIDFRQRLAAHLEAFMAKPADESAASRGPTQGHHHPRRQRAIDAQSVRPRDLTGPYIRPQRLSRKDSLKTAAALEHGPAAAPDAGVTSEGARRTSVARRSVSEGERNGEGQLSHSLAEEPITESESTAQGYALTEISYRTYLSDDVTYLAAHDVNDDEIESVSDAGSAEVVPDSEIEEWSD